MLGETQERVDGITSRLAFELRLIPGIELGAYQAYVESAVNTMLQVCYSCDVKETTHFGIWYGMNDQSSSALTAFSFSYHLYILSRRARIGKTKE